MSLFGNLIGKLVGKKLVNIENELTKLPISPDKLERCRREAGSGDIKAQFTLGGLYERGQGVPQDYSESAKWYQEAAEQGHAASQLYLGIYLALGRGVEQNVIEAYKWMELAKGGNLLDRTAANETQGNLVKFMNAEQIEEGKRLARQFVPFKQS